MFGRLKSKSLILVRAMLKEGMSLKKMSLCIALGITLGIFPVLGITTLLCMLAAFAFRLNQPAIQLVNYMVYPLQLALLAPFYSAGNWLFSQDNWRAPGDNHITMIKNDFWGSITSLWDLTLYAIFTWLVICPILVIVLYLALKPVIKSIVFLVKQRSS